MAYDEDLADRIRELVAGEDHVAEQRMFGGLAFLVNGNMAVAASGEGGLLVRVDPEAAEAWIDADGGVAPMVMRGREMRGWLRVRNGLDEAGLKQWVSRGIAFAGSLPPKQK
ncbi:TfoX/Sxy family protein [Humibacillus xanthopallidus]|uniref:TfoX-like protein n=1 Tax=Humibacillus xanthopallidus TaxID=412689 RepID=A0A543I2C8_9MICO|nr:TfoX/Sxy family protein [Humibacillus xanthopallidus]TQM64630.1 TfoX-like protein [Humibacillus xanthopallidus]